MNDKPLRQFSETHIDERLPDLRGLRFRDALFHDCRIGRVAGAVFERCAMAGSSVEVDDPRDLLGVTATLDCFTFRGLRLSSVALDALIFLLTMTVGNDATRKKLESCIDPRRLQLFRTMFPNLE